MRLVLACLMLLIASAVRADPGSVEQAYLDRATQLAADGNSGGVVPRLIRTGSPDAVARAFADGLENYLEKSVPTEPTLRAAFLDVLEATLAQADADFIEGLYLAGTNPPGPVTGLRKGLAELLDPIAHRVRENPQEALREARGPPEDWRTSREQAAHLVRNHLPGMAVGPDVSSSRQAAISWVNDRYSALFGDWARRNPDLGFDRAGMVRDLGRLLHLMTARNPQGGLRALDRLAEIGLDPRLASADLSPGSANDDPDTQLATYERVKAAIVAVLRDKEEEHGFRAEVLPTGILAADDFLSLPAAGYVIDDVGSTREHGALTHRLQWYAVMREFESTEGWRHTPLELFTAIGAFDRDLLAQNERRRFGFERQASLWAALFDRPGAEANAGAATLRQPDNLLKLLTTWADDTSTRLAGDAQRDGFDNFAEAMSTVDALRQSRTRQLLAEAKNELRQRSRNPVLRFLMPEPQVDRFGLDTETLRTILARGDYQAGEELFVRDYVAQRQAGFEWAQRPDGSDLAILVPRGTVLRRDADRRKLADLRRLWRDRLASTEPARANGPAEPVRLEEGHGIAAPSRRAAVRRLADLEDDFEDVGSEDLDRGAEPARPGGDDEPVLQADGDEPARDSDDLVSAETDDEAPDREDAFEDARDAEEEGSERAGPGGI